VSALASIVANIPFQNPVLLAAGTADYGEPLSDVIPLDTLGGLVTKAVSVEPRHGNPSPRVAEFPGGMINAVGLANPGLDAVKQTHLPWLTKHLTRARVIVNVVGSTIEDFATVITGLDPAPIISAYELNVSCPNVRAGGTEFGADLTTLTALITNARRATRRPLFVKLSPTLPNIADTAKAAIDAGADGITVINTIPGLVIDVDTRTPRVSFGSGGVSGPGLLPVGVLATWKVHNAISAPIIGVGGIASATDALQYFLAGASLVAIGTAAMRDPSVPARIIKDLTTWCTTHHHPHLSTLIGTVDWPTSP
jgi:dihydroorotate dehydrogenase (NAD+) catalytic subunit